MFGCKGIEEDYRGWEGLNARQVKNPLNNAFQSPSIPLWEGINRRRPEGAANPSSFSCSTSCKMELIIMANYFVKPRDIISLLPKKRYNFIRIYQHGMISNITLVSAAFVKTHNFHEKIETFFMISNAYLHSFRYY